MLILRLLLILGTSLLGSQLLGQEAALFPRKMTQANNAYRNGDYLKAITTYEEILQDGYQSVALYNNLGNAYLQSQQFGMARLQYERALLLDPEDQMVLENRNHLLKELEDQIQTGDTFFLFQWHEELMLHFGVRTWSLFAFLFALLTALLLAALWQFEQWRKKWRSWTLLGLTFIGLLLSIHFALARSAREHNPMRGIIMADEVMLQVAPDSQSEEMFPLHEGTAVFMLDSIGAWWKVRLDNHREGWLPRDAFVKLSVLEKNNLHPPEPVE